MKKFEYTTGYLFRMEAADINEVTQLLGRYGVDGWLFTGHAKDVMNGTFYTFVREVESETKPELVHFCEICQGPAIHKTSRHPWPNREIVKNAPDAARAELMARVLALADECARNMNNPTFSVDARSAHSWAAYRLRALVDPDHAETDRGRVVMWSWILTAVGLTGFILAGRRVWWCWYVNIACQGLWLAYALTTHQYGFIAASLIYTVVFTQNAVRWTRDRHHAETAVVPDGAHGVNAALAATRNAPDATDSPPTTPE